MPIAELFDGTRLEFPDDTDPAVIQSTVKRLTLERQPKQKEGLLTSLQRGAESTFGDISTGFSGAFNPTEAAKAGIEREEEMRQRLGPTESRLSKVENAYNDKGLLSAIGTGLGEIPGAIAEQVPNLGVAFGGARLGATAGSLAGPVGAGVGAVAGAFLPFFLQQYGGNIKQQAEVQKEKGQEVDVSGAKAAAYAVPMAGLDVAEAFIPFGGKMIGKIFGPSVERLLARGMTKEAEEVAAKKLAEESFLPSLKSKDFGTLVKGTTKASALEIPTEVTQQLLGRAQSGQDLFSKDAIREYGETAFDVALLGPLGILGRVNDKSAARNTILQAQQKAAKTNEIQEVTIPVNNDEGQEEPKVFYVDSTGFASSNLEDFKYKEELEKRQQEASRQEREARRLAKQSPISQGPLYVGPEGQAGEDIDQVSEEDRKLGIVKQSAQEKQDLLNNTITPELVKSWGIKGKPITLQSVMGKDIRDPEQASAIKTQLLNLQKKTSVAAVKKNIDEYLKRPEFQIAPTEVAPPPIETTPPKEEPKDLLVEPKISESELWQNIQNRDRATVGSIEQMNDIANVPEYYRISYSNSFTEGAPVVTGDALIPKEQLGRKGVVIGSDNKRIPVQYAVVDAGEVQASHNVNGERNPNYVSEGYQGLRAITNGRVAGMQAGYARGTMDDYVTDLTHDDMHGIKKSVIKNMKRPMLVRIMPQDMISKHTGDISNVGSGLTLNVIEQAKNDIKRININNLTFDEDGNININTVIDFIRGMPKVEQNGLMTDGEPARQAFDRLDAAIFQEAYQNNKLTQLAFAAKDSKIRLIVKALTIAAPSAIHLEGLGEYDVRPYVNEAVEMAINARNKGMKLSDMLEQMNRQDSFTPIHPIAKDIFAMLADDARSGKAMGENLNKLFDNAFDEATKEPDMFGGLDKKPIHQVVKDSFEEKPAEDLLFSKSNVDEKTDSINQTLQQQEGASQGDLFADYAEVKEKSPAENTQEELPKLSEEGLTVPKGRHPQVVAAARERQAGRMSREQYDRYVNKYMPIGTVNTPRPPASLNKMKEVLKSNQIDKLNPSIKNGTRVGLRMDINALQKGGSVVSIHEGGTEKTLGNTIGYSSTARVKNVTFAIRREAGSLKVATGENYKAPQQTVEGEWVQSNPEQDYKDIQSLLNNPSWSQVSLDPLRHSYFYDRKSTNPVKSADEVIQVGNFLLAKNVKFGNKSEYLYSQDVSNSKIKKEEQDIESQLKGKSLLEASRWTIDNAPNKFSKVIANMVHKRITELSDRGIKLDFEVQGGDKRLAKLYGARGLMSSTFGKDGKETSFKVVLNGAAIKHNQDGYPSGMRYITVLHELLHVATKGQLTLLNNNDSLVKELNDLRNLVVKDFNKRVKEGNLTPFLTRIYRNEVNTLQNIDELISWGLTDKDTQEYLSTIKVGEKTIFNKLVDLIRQVLGINKDYETALDRLVKTSESILSEDIKTIAGRIEQKGYVFGSSPTSKGTIGEQQSLFEKSKNKYVTVDEILKMKRDAYKELSQTEKFKKSQQKIEEAREQYFQRFNDVKKEAVRLLKEHPEYKNINQAIMDKKIIDRLAMDVFKNQAEENVPQPKLSEREAIAAQEKLIESFFKTKNIPEPRKFNEYANQNRDYYSNPKFLKWFNGSKVVDKNGQPLVAFHTTDKNFNVFKTGSNKTDSKSLNPNYTGQLGSWFTAPALENNEYELGNAENAVSFSEGKEGDNTMLVHLSIKNPMEYEGFDDLREDRDSFSSINEYKKSLIKKGYDGIVIRDSLTDGDVYRDDWVAFEPNQIKSAIGNNGEYNIDNPDIRYEMSLEGIDPKTAKLTEDTFGKQEPKTYVETIKDLASRARERFKYMVADSFSDIEKVSKQGYMKSRLSKTVDTQMQVLLDYGHLMVRGGTLGYKNGTKGLKAIYAPLGNEVERFQVWVALNRDVNLPKEKRSFKDELVNKRNEFIKGDLNGVPRAKLYEQARKEQQELNNSVLDVAKELGLIDDEAYQRFKSDAYYIPFYKEMENGDVEGARIASKLTGQKFSHALKGGEKKVNDLMDNMLRNWSHIISASLKNDAAVTTLKDAVSLGVATPVKAFQKSNANVVKVMENGVPSYYKVDDQHLIDNIAMINYVGKQSALFKAMTKPSAWLRYGVTLSPGYKIRNLVKDTVTTIAVSDADLNAVNTFKKGWDLTNKTNEQFANALASGAVFQLGSSHDGKSADLIKKLISEGIPGNTILNTQEKMTSAISKMFHAYQGLGDRLENVNRMALYDKLIKEGKSPLEAAFESRDLLDFTSQGASRSLQVLSQLVPFMNTRIQGLYKLYRTGTDAQKQQRLFYTLGTIAFASGALYMMNKDDDDFKKRQDWDRDNFWWFKIGDTAFRIPKPYEIGGIGTLTERGLEQFADDSVESQVFFKRMGQYFLDTLSLDPTPQAIKPLWNVLNNKDSFTSMPIETPGMERYTKTERYADRTSGTAKGLSKAINMPLSAVGLENTGPSPVQIEYLAQGYFGWLGGILGSTAARAFEDKPTKPLLDAIGIAQTEPEVNSKYITDFYQNNAKIQNYFNDMKRYAQQGDNEKVAEILKEKGNLIGLQQLYNQTVNQISQQRKYIQMISEDKSIPREEREKMIVVQKEVMSKMAENVESFRKSLNK